MGPWLFGKDPHLEPPRIFADTCLPAGTPERLVLGGLGVPELTPLDTNTTYPCNLS